MIFLCSPLWIVVGTLLAAAATWVTIEWLWPVTKKALSYENNDEPLWSIVHGVLAVGSDLSSTVSSQLSPDPDLKNSSVELGLPLTV